MPISGSVLMRLFRVVDHNYSRLGQGRDDQKTTLKNWQAFINDSRNLQPMLLEGGVGKELIDLKVVATWVTQQWQTLADRTTNQITAESLLNAIRYPRTNIKYDFPKKREELKPSDFIWRPHIYNDTAGARG